MIRRLRSHEEKTFCFCFKMGCGSLYKDIQISSDLCVCEWMMCVLLALLWMSPLWFRVAWTSYKKKKQKLREISGHVSAFNVCATNRPATRTSVREFFWLSSVCFSSKSETHFQFFVWLPGCVCVCVCARAAQFGHNEQFKCGNEFTGTHEIRFDFKL